MNGNNNPSLRFNNTNNKTKILATLGPASNTYDKILSMVNAGANIFRLNFSHGNHETKKNLIGFIRQINKDKQLNLSILGDLQGPKLRVGKIKDDELMLNVGDMVHFSNQEVEGTLSMITVSYPNLSSDIKVGNKILIDDGKIEVSVIEVTKNGVIKTIVLQGGIIKSNKGFNLPDTKISLPALTEKDLEDLEFIIEQKLDWVALSFVKNVKDINLLKFFLQQKESKTKVIAKIEMPEALDHINEIINESDGIMIARGDLGVELPVEKVPLVQKSIIRKCIHRAKPVIVATQMMESMIELSKPNRSEITDVANAVVEGADAVMLSAETAAGKHPELVIATMKKIILEVENNIFEYNRADDLTPQKHSPSFLSDALCYNACKIAVDVDAKALIGMTQTGFTGFTLSSFRPSAPLYVFATNQLLVTQLSLSWGVTAFYFPEGDNVDEIFNKQIEMLKAEGLLNANDVIVSTGSLPVDKKLPTNMVKISIVP